jgi:uroporphyrinogen-III synthase
MLQHYNTLHRDSPNPPLLFLVGEQRRDIIPKTLMSPSLPSEQRIPVQETVVYETGEMASFEADFRDAVSESESGEGEGEGVLWVVVFSPSGCEAMLRVLGLGPYAGNKGSVDGRKVFVATIGPTTRDYFRGLGFEPHVCAERPSPEGVGEGIRRFMEEKGI